MDNLNPYQFYGCFNGGSKKMYRWQCKAFSTEKEATHYALSNSQYSDIPTTYLIELPRHIPRFFHGWCIENVIKKQTRVDII